MTFAMSWRRFFFVLSVCLCSALGSTVAEAKKKIVILDLKMAGVGAEEAKTLKSTLGGILAKSVTDLGYEVMSSADIQAIIGLERLKDLAGCESDTSCFTELGGALGADFLIGGSVGKLGDKYNVTLSLVDNDKAEAKSRFQGAAGTASALTLTVKRGVGVLFKKTKEVRSTGMLLIKTVPPGASVKLNGKLAGNSPLSLDMPAGDHEISATLAGLTGRDQVLVKPSEVTKITINLTQPPVAIRANSNPPEAKLFIDGQAVGTTPFISEAIRSGERTLRFELEGYAVKEMTVQLNIETYEAKNKEPFVVSADLRKRWLVEPGLVLGAVGNLDRIGDGMAPQVELTFDFARHFQAGMGFAGPKSFTGSARGYFYRDIFEVGAVGQFAMFGRSSQADTAMGSAFGGGLTTGLVFELPVGEVGGRLELLGMIDGQNGGVTLPIQTGVFWRMR